MPTNWFDQFTSQDELLAAIGQQLEDQSTILQSILQSEGVASNPDATQYRPTPFENEVIPTGSGRFPMPAGRTTFDFVEGEVTHDGTGDLSESLRTFDDMSDAIDGASIQALRSLYVYVDTQVQLELDNGRSGKFTIDPSLYFPIQSQGFKRFVIEADRPTNVYAVVSTRSRAFTSDAVQNHTDRSGSRSDTGSDADSYVSVPVKPYGLADSLPSSASVDNWDDPVIDARAHNRHSFVVENTGSNDIDARIVAAEDDDLTFREIGAQSTGIASGDFTVFDIQERHKFYRVEYRNSTNGNDVSAEVDYFGGS